MVGGREKREVVPHEVKHGSPKFEVQMSPGGATMARLTPARVPPRPPRPLRSRASIAERCERSVSVAR